MPDESAEERRSGAERRGLGEAADPFRLSGGAATGVTAWQGFIAIATIVSATAAAYQGLVSGDALIGLYGTLLGYIFGSSVANGSQGANG